MPSKSHQTAAAQVGSPQDQPGELLDGEARGPPPKFIGSGKYGESLMMSKADGL